MKRQITATLLAWVIAVAAQQAPPKQQGQAGQKDANGNFKFETTSRLVVETVILKDKAGNPIEGLTKNDFLITEDGKKQDVSFAEFQKLETMAAPEPAVQTRTEAEPKKEEPKEEPKVKAVTANAIAPEKPGDIKYKDKRLLVMFFDMTSMPIQDQFRAQTAAVKFLKTQMTPSDLMAIMTFSSEVKVVEDFTDDRDLLAKDIKNLTIGEGQGLDETTSDDSSSDTGAAFQQDDTEFNIFNTDRQLSALETAVKMLGSLNEKKALVYFASGMQRNGVDNQAQLQATINAAIRSNTAFYPIDARGLVAQAPLGDATKSSPGGSAMYNGSSARSAQSNFQGQQETLFTLASDTGGKALLDNNDLSVGIVQAQKDISSYYILGYYTTNEKLDGHFRRVKIALRNEGLTARVAKFDYRQGYYAGKEFNKFTSEDKERQLAEALMLGDPVTDIDIAMEVDYFRMARDRYFVPVAVKIPGSALELATHGGAESTKIDFIGQVKDPKGQVVGNVRDAADIKLKGETAGSIAKHTIEYDTGFTLAPGTYSIRVLARDSVTGKMGTYDQKFIIPDLTTETKRLPISSVVLSSQRQDLSAAVFSAEKDKKLLSANPLVEDGKKLIPSVTRVFNKNQDLYVYLQAYEPQADTTQPLIATVSFIRGKVKAFETAPLQVSEGLDPKSKSLPLKFDVPLNKLAPGKYTCQVNVIDPNGQKFAFWRAPMMLMP
ncbi:MAG TPA: VWA domain-containing protein [Candidatus Limnocylindrales bacterium]|nr:VWA domain-containing protein [Candidatus Limnocylindrales bacterium]